MPDIKNTRVLATVSVLIAANILLSRFLSISVWNFKIGFGFVPIALCAVIFGPLLAGLAGAAADFAGAMLFPVGPYFVGFTFSAALTGIIFGLFLYKKKAGPLRVAAAVITNAVIVSLLINTYWISAVYSASFFALLPARLIQSAIMSPVQFAVILLMKKREDVFKVFRTKINGEE